MINSSQMVDLTGSKPFSNQSRKSKDCRQVDKLLKEKKKSERCQQTESVNYINAGLDDQTEIHGYKKDLCRMILTWTFIVLTLGTLRLIFHWCPHLMLYATHKKCSLAVAEKVLILEKYQNKQVSFTVKNVLTISSDKIQNKSKIISTNVDDEQLLESISTQEAAKLSLHVSGGVFKSCDSLRLFLYKKLCYVWDEDKYVFVKLCGLDQDVPTSFHHQQKGLTLEEQIFRRMVYGNNEISVPVCGVFTLLFLEVLNPFYIFQLCSFLLWFIDDYVFYAMAILIMSAFGIVMAIIQTRKNQLNLRSTVHSSDVAVVVRGGSGQNEVIPTEDLVPGDVLVIPSHGCIMRCDAVLLNGTCIVNESMLTGESVPVTKTALPNSADEFYDDKEHARSTLFCGTQVIQTRYFGGEHILAVVIRTGFSTAKGNLVRSILYPPPVDFKFENDSYKFVGLLAVIASLGFIYTVITKYLRGISSADIALKSLDLITVVVPPALPAAMTVGRFYAQKRLEKKGVYCISPRAINVSGSVDCVCFDKTGTLTEDGLDMWGVLPVVNHKFQLPIKYVEKMDQNELLFGMAVCHSLTIIEGNLSGDPLDLKMFESTKWLLEEPNVSDNSKYDNLFPTVVRPPDSRPLTDAECEEISNLRFPLEIGILRQFPFSSSLQRMSVITRKLGASEFQVYCKGSPEMIASLCLPESVPHTFSSVLEDYTKEGYRVLALAYKGLGKLNYVRVHRLSREDAESDLIFLGLIVMENRLKPGTSEILASLTDANIRTVMITGDNMLTALSVARDCGIVSFNQRVIVATAVPPQDSNPACLYFTNSPNNVQSPDIISQFSEISNSDSQISFKTVNSSTQKNSPTSYSLVSDATVESCMCNEPTNYCFAMTGKTWDVVMEYFPETVPKLVTRGTVFARMSPDQKQQLVQELQHIGYYVAMCGDGANDCGALKAAHAGVSLSEAESSVASPFMSKVHNISCIPDVIREGRAALVTSFGIFKYMAGYSFTQFVTVMILYSIDSNLTDIEYLYIDLFIITIFAFFFGHTEAYDGPLARSPPIMSLISLSPVLSLVLQVIVVIILQCTAFYVIQEAPFFEPFNITAHGEDGSIACYENYALFAISSMQYIILALVFSRGPPYRKPFYTNYGFLISLILLTAFTIYLIVYPLEIAVEWFELKMADSMEYRLIMLSLGFVNLVLAIFIEYFVVDYLITQKLKHWFRTSDKYQKKFITIDKSIQKDSSWPPISEEPVIDPLSDASLPPSYQNTKTKYENSSGPDYLENLSNKFHSSNSPSFSCHIVINCSDRR